jgi:hypothetical protein
LTFLSAPVSWLWENRQQPLPRPFRCGEPLRAGDGLEASEFPAFEEDGEPDAVLELRRPPHPWCHHAGAYTLLRH